VRFQSFTPNRNAGRLTVGLAFLSQILASPNSPLLGGLEAYFPDNVVAGNLAKILSLALWQIHTELYPELKQPFILYAHASKNLPPEINRDSKVPLTF